MTVVGYGDHRYELDDSWPNIPEGWTLGNGWAGPRNPIPYNWFAIGITDVAADSNDRIYVCNRDKHPVVVFEADSGDFVTSWGEYEFKEAHGIHVDSEDNVWTTDRQDHIAMKHTKYGELLLEIGNRGWGMASVSPFGTHPSHAFLGGPFNMPAGVSTASTGAIFVADGYGNRQVHRFDPSGERELSWGISGTGEGEFSLVHNVDVDSQDRVYICDRENDRIQIFDYDGNFIESWNDLYYPGGVHCDRENLVYVAEQGGSRRNRDNGFSVFSESGELVCAVRRPYEEKHPQPHGICIDSKGNIYLAQLPARKKADMDHKVSKYVKIR